MPKLTILGDVMCEGPFLEGAFRKPELDFRPAFKGLAPLLAKSDLVIANLETPFAGQEAGYSDKREMYSFNTPDVFAEAMVDLGVDVVLTANNHCCDRGIDGLLRTLQVLDSMGLSHTGTYADSAGSHPLIVNVGDVRVAIISCTSSTNVARIGFVPGTDHVNLLDEQVVPPALSGGIADGLKRFVKNRIIGEYRTKSIKKALGRTPTRAYADDVIDKRRIAPYLDRMCSQVDRMQECADLVIVCPHMGGQFNVIPGAISEYVMSALAEAGASAVVASHPHVIQHFERKGGVPCFFSLGNVSMSMSTVYINKEAMPQYGMVAHLYVEGRQIERVSYSLIEMTEDETGYVRVVPLRDAYLRAGAGKRENLLRDANLLAHRIAGANAPVLTEITDEVVL